MRGFRRDRLPRPDARRYRPPCIRPPVDYVYFVSKNDGTHAFATTLEEHNRNVYTWQVEYFRKQRQQQR